MVCVWCGNKGPTVNHHYPEQKQYEGTETVTICPNCHQASHQGIIVNATMAKDKADFDRIVYDDSLRAIKQFFPLLYATGSFCEPFEKKGILNPSWMWKEGIGNAK